MIIARRRASAVSALRIVNYRALWTGLFPGSLGNSIVVSLGSTVLSLLLGVPAAYALSRWRFRGRRRLALWILASRMAPPVAYTIPFFFAYRYLGLIDTLARPGHDLSDLQPRACRLDAAQFL